MWFADWQFVLLPVAIFAPVALVGIGMALASCAPLEDDAARHPFRLRWTWHFPPGLHQPARQYFPYALPDRE
jgi:hypothetical protein